MAIPSSMVTNVAITATPRITTLNVRGTNASASAASSGAKKMKVKMDMRGGFPGSFERQIQHHRHAQREEKGVGLQTAGLHHAQRAADQFGRSVQAADSEAGDNPAVNEIGNRSQKIV